MATKLASLLILFLPSLALAGGPLSGFSDPTLDKEMTNIYHDIKSIKTIGRVIQSSESLKTANDSTSNTSFTDSSCHGTITPQFASSVIRVTATFTGGNDTAGKTTFYSIFRDGTENLYGTSASGAQTYVNAGTVHFVPVTLVKYDSPGDVSPHLYRVKYYVDSGSNGYVGGGISCVVLMEEISQ